MPVKVELKGLPSLRNKLRAIGAEIAKSGLRPANYAGAKVIKEAMINAAPVKTGLLKSSIAMFRRRGSATRSEYAIGFRKLTRRFPNTAKNRRKKRVGTKYRVDGPAFYARFVEYGTSKWPTGNPFMRKTLRGFRGQAIDAMRDELKNTIDRMNNK